MRYLTLSLRELYPKTPVFKFWVPTQSWVASDFRVGRGDVHGSRAWEPSHDRIFPEKCTEGVSKDMFSGKNLVHQPLEAYCDCSI